MVFTPACNEPEAANYATLNTRNGHPTLDFDTTTAESAVFSFVVPRNYAGGGITVYVIWCAASATTGTIGWLIEFERVDAGTLDIDADSYASTQTVTAATVSGTSGVTSTTNVAVSNGANMDSIAVGELARLRIKRDVGNDNASGDAQLLAVELKET